MKRAFEVKQKTFFLTSKVLFFRHTKHTGKNVADTIFKACVRYLLSNFYFSPNDSPSKTMKNVFYFI